MTSIFPNLNRTMSDIYEDELYHISNVNASNEMDIDFYSNNNNNNNSLSNNTNLGGNTNITNYEFESNSFRPEIEPFNEFSDPNLDLNYNNKQDLQLGHQFIPSEKTYKDADLNDMLNFSNYDDMNNYDGYFVDDRFANSVKQVQLSPLEFAEELSDLEYDDDEDDDDEDDDGIVDLYDMNDDDMTSMSGDFYGNQMSSFNNDAATSSAGASAIEKMFLSDSSFTSANNSFPDVFRPLAQKNYYEPNNLFPQKSGSIETPSLNLNFEDNITDLAQHNGAQGTEGGDFNDSNDANGFSSNQCTLINTATNTPCMKKFSRPYDLIRHQQTIHASKKKIFRCVICETTYKKSVANENDETKSLHSPKTFSRGDALSRHIRVKHGLTGNDVTEAIKYAKDNVEYVDIKH